MALITCPECKKEISSEALSCPNCGYTLKKMAEPKKKSSKLAVGCLVIIAFGIFLTIIGKYCSPSPKNTNASSSSKSSELPSIDVAPNMTVDQLKSSTLHLRKKVDDVKNITWYYHQYSPKYSNSRTAISIYFGKSGNVPIKPRLLLNYVSSDWLFVERYIVKADAATFEISPQYGEIETDNGTLANGEVGIWEWFHFFHIKFNNYLLS